MRTGFLLTGDLDLARDRVAAAVAATAGRDGTGSGAADPEYAVLAHVVRATVRAEAERARPVNVATEPAPPAEPGQDREPVPAGELRRRLRAAVAELPAEQRAVVVLELYADLDRATVAGLLRRRPEAVTAASDAAYARLGTVVAAAGAEASGVIAETAATLAAQAREVPLDPAPYARVQPLLRRRRRRTGLLVTGVVAVLAVLVAGYAVVAARQPDRPVATGGVLTWPARGALARDTGLAEAVRERAGGGHLLYLADLAGGRVGLVVSRYASGAVSLTVLQGRAGAAPAALDVTQEGSYPAGTRVVAWADPERAGSPLVVLAPSVARVAAVSTVAEPSAGLVARASRRHPMRGGVLATTARAASYTMIRVAVDGPSGRIYDGPVTGIERNVFYPGADPPRPLRRYGDEIDVQAWRSAAAEFAGTYRVPYRRLRVVWRWTKKDGPHTAWVAAVYRLPGGADVLQVRWWSRDLGDGTAINRYVRGRPIRDTDLPVAWRAGELVGVFYPGHPHHVVTVGTPGGRYRRLRTDRHGYLQIAAPGRSDPDVIVRTPPAFDVGIPVRSPFDDDPLDVGRARQGA